MGEDGKPDTGEFSGGGSATAAVEEIVQEPQDVNISVPDGQTSALDGEAYVTDAYTLHLDEFNGCDYHIPQINLTGNDAAAINQEIYDKYYNDIQEALYRANSTGFYGDPGMFDLYYDWYVNGDILSLVVQSWWMDSGHDVDVYNMSLSSQARLDNRSIYEAAELTDEEFETLLISLVEQSVKSLYSNMDSDTFAYMKSDLAESTSSSNISSSLPYIYADVELCVFVKRKFSLGQNTWSWCEFTNLGNVRILNVTQNDSKEASLEVSENYETTTGKYI